MEARKLELNVKEGAYWRGGYNLISLLLCISNVAFGRPSADRK